MNTENKSNTPVEIKDLWQTPIEIFKSLDLEFDFTCDVASSKENTLCSVHIDEKQNALAIDEWSSSNWCNPPYSNIGPWVDKAIEQHSLGNTTVMLVPSDTSVKWFKNAFMSCSEVRFITGRISFINAGTGKAVSGNNKGSVLLIWRGFSPKGSKSVSLIDRGELKLY
tara:strand:- start:44 stop:547 length:504 start_codon:yes stop_codon:yes gene_type:complete